MSYKIRNHIIYIISICFLLIFILKQIIVLRISAIDPLMVQFRRDWGFDVRDERGMIVKNSTTDYLTKLTGPVRDDKLGLESEIDDCSALPRLKNKVASLLIAIAFGTNSSV